MEKIYRFAVIGSGGNEYTVAFNLQPAPARASCSCQAGTNGKHCKHRIAIMTGDRDGVIGDRSEDLKNLVADLQGTALQLAVDGYVTAEQSFEASRRQLDAAKRDLDAAFKGKPK